jgi:hypothetical protein
LTFHSIQQMISKTFILPKVFKYLIITNIVLSKANWSDIGLLLMTVVALGITGQGELPNIAITNTFFLEDVIYWEIPRESASLHVHYILTLLPRLWISNTRNTVSHCTFIALYLYLRLRFSKDSLQLSAFETLYIFVKGTYVEYKRYLVCKWNRTLFINNLRHIYRFIIIFINFYFIFKYTLSIYQTWYAPQLGFIIYATPWYFSRLSYYY